jgi:L-ascorbate metabolism protein UlaG (beta-lactamase superfamily)
VLDAIVLTHEHGDHADPAALGPLGRLTTTSVIGPAACIEIARKADVPEDRLKVLAHEEAISVGELRLTAVDANDPGAPGCNGYVLETGKVTVLQAGDSLYFQGFLDYSKRWAFDAICVSVGDNPPGGPRYLEPPVQPDRATRLACPLRIVERAIANPSPDHRPSRR